MGAVWIRSFEAFLIIRTLLIVYFSIDHFLWFYNLFWGAKVTVQMRVLSAPTFFNKKIGICTQILYN